MDTHCLFEYMSMLPAYVAKKEKKEKDMKNTISMFIVLCTKLPL